MSMYIFIVAIVVFVGKVGDMFGMVLLVQGWERTLLLLNSNDLHCALAANRLPVLQWFAISCTRRMLEDPLFYMLGRHHGERATEWIKKKIPATAKAESVLKQASCVAVAVDPGAFVCTMAGVHGMPLPSFYISNFVGTVIRLGLIYLLALTFPSQLDYVTDTIRHYQTIVLFLAVLFVSCTSWKFVNVLDTQDADT